MTARLRRLYGASPLHALAHLVWVCAAGWALLELLDVPPLAYVLGWLVAAVVLHDLVLLPLYAVLDRVVVASPLPRGAVNHLRVPVVVSGVLLLAFLPVILGRGEAQFARVSGADYDESYLGRWLLASAVLFAASAVLYGLRAARSGRSGRRSAGSTS